MTQTNIIDALEEDTNNAVNIAGAYANPAWYQEAEATVSILIRQGNDFTTDDVWELLEHTGLRTPEPRALGSIIRFMAKEGLIKATGSYRKSLRKECHRRPLAVWRPVNRRTADAL